MDFCRESPNIEDPCFYLKTKGPGRCLLGRFPSRCPFKQAN